MFVSSEKQLELEGDLLIITAQNVYLRDDPWFQETIRKKLVQRMIPDLRKKTFEDKRIKFGCNSLM